MKDERIPGKDVCEKDPLFASALAEAAERFKTLAYEAARVKLGLTAAEVQAKLEPKGPQSARFDGDMVVNKLHQTHKAAVPKFTPADDDDRPLSQRGVVDDIVVAFFDAGHPYHNLAEALIGAYQQAAFGKGKERHANDLPFHDQPMQRISNLLDSPDGMAYQVIKKVQESLRMGPTAAERELYGAIVYAAGMIVRLREDEVAR